MKAIVINSSRSALEFGDEVEVLEDIGGLHLFSQRHRHEYYFVRVINSGLEQVLNIDQFELVR